MANKKTAAQVARSAKADNRVINTNPGYIFRTLNKRAQGRDRDAKEVEGYSRESLKELFNRLNDTFSGGGFWWSSIYAVNGRPVTSVSEVKEIARYGELEQISPIAWAFENHIPRAENHVLIQFAGAFYLATLGTFSENAVIDAAKARLQLVEKYAAALDKEQEKERKEQERKERKEQRKEQRKQASKERKEQKEQAKELTKVLQDLRAQVAAGTLSSEQAAAKVQALFAA